MGLIYFLLFGPAIGGVLGLIIGLIIKCMGYDSGSCYCGGSLSSMETEMKNHNARMEQMMQEQQRIMIDNEARRISESNNRPLSEQFDSRLTNVFRNPWDGIL